MWTIPILVGTYCWLLLMPIQGGRKYTLCLQRQPIDKLRHIFGCHGLPTTLVSDNGSPFQSMEFQQFVAANGIVHRRVPPYHPSSNGLAENMVKTVRHALSKAKVTKDVTLDTHITAYYNIQNSGRASPQPCATDSPFFSTPLYFTAIGASCRDASG